MSNYIGVRCPVCNKKFTETDDIVVCPVCGAPHHRDCYAQENQCAFAEDHLSGKVWTDPAGQTPPSQGEDGESGTRTCPRCAADNAPDNIFCSVCGTPLSMEQQPPGQGGAYYPPQGYPGYMRVDAISMAYGGLNPEEEIAGEKVRDIAQYVGQGSAYYLPRFRTIDERNRSFSMNLSALLFNFLYYFYRKMYLAGGFLLVLYIIGSVPSYLYTWEILPNVMAGMSISAAVAASPEAAHLYWLTGLTRTINIVIGLVISGFANKYYFSHVIADVRQIRVSSEEAGDSIQRYNEKLAGAGGCNKVAVIVVVVSLIVALFIASGVMVSLYLESYM